MQTAAAMFQPQELERLAPRLHPALAERNGRPSHSDTLSQRLDPLAATEEIAYDFLAKGGKHSRPFITLAAYQAAQPAAALRRASFKRIQSERGARRGETLCPVDRNIPQSFASA